MRAAATALLLALPSVAFAGNPWEELMGPGKPRLWSDPEGRFSLDLPVNWKAMSTEGEPVVTFEKHNPDHGQSAVVSVEVRNVPPGVRLSHFAARVDSEVSEAVRNVHVVSRDKLKVAGVPARRTHFTYQERGNAQLTSEVVQVVFVTGERAWVIRLLTVYGARGLFWQDFEKMVKGFNPSGAKEPAVQKRGGRKRLRAGEMVNPDLLKY